LMILDMPAAASFGRLGYPTVHSRCNRHPREQQQASTPNSTQHTRLLPPTRHRAHALDCGARARNCWLRFRLTFLWG
jgi:hypothetical protein